MAERVKPGIDDDIIMELYSTEIDAETYKKIHEKEKRLFSASKRHPIEYNV